MLRVELYLIHMHILHKPKQVKTRTMKNDSNIDQFKSKLNIDELQKLREIFKTIEFFIINLRKLSLF